MATAKTIRSKQSRPAPAKRQTLAELRALQRLAGGVIMNPLARDWRMQRRWIDDRDMREVTAEFIKPNDRLTSFERIEIYNRQYWFRLIDSCYDDFPGLRAVLGRLKFNRLMIAYIIKHPSRSYTMRNLGKHLPSFIERHPELAAPRFDLAIDMARFEWAQVEAFDGPAKPVVTVDDLLGKDPSKIRLGIQPFITALQLRYPLDDYVLQLKKDGLRGEASNAVDEASQFRKQKRQKPIPRRRLTYVVVHRHDNALYYKRLDEPGYHLIQALAAGKTITQAIAKAFTADADPATVQRIFTTWSALGWFCKPECK
jgi:hypothetical protein